MPVGGMTREEGGGNGRKNSSVSSVKKQKNCNWREVCEEKGDSIDLYK
jgi:hypothetical protein